MLTRSVSGSLWPPASPAAPVAGSARDSGSELRALSRLRQALQGARAALSLGLRRRGWHDPTLRLAVMI